MTQGKGWKVNNDNLYERSKLKCPNVNWMNKNPTLLSIWTLVFSRLPVLLATADTAL